MSRTCGRAARPRFRGSGTGRRGASGRARVAVVESAEMRDGADATGPALDLARLGRVAVEREMAARTVVEPRR